MIRWLRLVHSTLLSFANRSIHLYTGKRSECEALQLLYVCGERASSRECVESVSPNEGTAFGGKSSEEFPHLVVYPAAPRTCVRECGSGSALLWVASAPVQELAFSLEVYLQRKQSIKGIFLNRSTNSVWWWWGGGPLTWLLMNGGDDGRRKIDYHP